MTTSQPTHEYEIFDDKWVISLTRFGASSIPNSEWDEFIEAASKVSDLKCIIGVSKGAVALTTAQRKSSADIMKKHGAMAVVITNDRMVRGIATAVSWFGVKVKAFSWEQIERAVEHAGATGDTAAAMVKAIEDFEAKQS